MKFDLFVMVTDWAADSSTDDLDQGTSYCGVKDAKYPDNRAMGFPFDRQIDKKFLKAKDQSVVGYLKAFTDHFKNMETVAITISFKPDKKSTP